jgi:hypothetical protein
VRDWFQECCWRKDVQRCKNRRACLLSAVVPATSGNGSRFHLARLQRHSPCFSQRAVPPDAQRHSSVIQVSAAGADTFDFAWLFEKTGGTRKVYAAVATTVRTRNLHCMPSRYHMSLGTLLIEPNLFVNLIQCQVSHHSIHPL